MNGKMILTGGLLLFVAISLTLAIADVAGWRRAGVSSTLSPSDAAFSEGDPVVSTSTTPTLTAIYFHAPHRCPTCKKIEAYTHEALESAIADRQITWQVVDYTSPEHAEMVGKFKVFTSTVVLTETRAGQIVRWKNVEEVWNHTDNQAEFVTFMRETWNGFRGNL